MYQISENTAHCLYFTIHATIEMRHALPFILAMKCHTNLLVVSNQEFGQECSRRGAGVECDRKYSVLDVPLESAVCFLHGNQAKSLVFRLFCAP